MATIPGSVRVAGFIAPTDTTDTYAVTDEVYNRGGYRSVNSIVERDSITTDRRKLGMLVYDTTTSIFYQLVGGLTNANWVVWASPNVGGASKYSEIIGNNTDTIFAIQHNLNTVDVVVGIYDASTGAQVKVDVAITTNQTIEVRFAYPPTLNSYRVVVG